MKHLKEELKELVTRQKRVFSDLGMYYYYVSKDDSTIPENIKELIHEANMLEYKKRIIQEKIEEMEDKQDMKIICPACHSELEKDSIFCNKCGIKLNEYGKSEKKEMEAADEKLKTVILDSDTSNKSMERKCENCGTILKENQMFCTQCGRKYVI